MRTLIKTFLRNALVPVLRVFAPLTENVVRMKAFVLLSSRINRPLDASVVIMGTAEVHGTGDIRCGKKLLLYPALYLETNDKGFIEIGDDVVISRGVHIAARTAIKIGAGSMIGEYTSIRDANHERDTNNSIRDGLHSSAPITIGSQVWIGRSVTILPGVSIGNNATVGANAVVTHNVPPGVTVVGVPAVPIGYPRGEKRMLRVNNG